MGTFIFIGTFDNDPSTYVIIATAAQQFVLPIAEQIGYGMAMTYVEPRHNYLVLHNYMLYPKHFTIVPVPNDDIVVR